MRIAVPLVILVALGACDLAPPGGYRDPAAPISASTRFDARTFEGSWRIVESFGTVPGGQLVFAPLADGGTIALSGTGLRTVDGRYREGVPGELIPVSAPGRAPLVVMWVDEARETAAIGTVSGTFGVLVDRDGKVPPDKRLAARAIFDFYGWDIGRLERVES